MRKYSANLFVRFLLTGIFGLFCFSPVARAASLVVAWGDNSFGQTNVPPDLTNVLAIASGFYHGLALNGDGTVTAWGKNDLGQANVPAGFSNVVAIAGGEAHSLALKADGTITAWGDNSLGQTDMPADLSNVVAIAAGQYHSLALRADGTVTAWGDNISHQTNVPITLSNVIAIAAGSSHSLALKANGAVIAWGDNTANQSTPPFGLNSVVAIAAGGLHSMALKSDGKIVMWGSQTNVPVGFFGNKAAVVSVHPGTTNTTVSKTSAMNGNVVVDGSHLGPTIVNGGAGYAILANGRVNVDKPYVFVDPNFVSMTNWGTANEVPDYTTPGSSDQLFDINRFIAVADLTPNGPSPSRNNHFTNLTEFKAAVKTNNLPTNPFEGVIVVDVRAMDLTSGLTPTNCPNGVNIRGTFVFNSAPDMAPLNRLFVTAAININAADLSGLVVTNPATYKSGYPPVYSDPAKNPANIDISSQGFVNFSSSDELPAVIQNIATFDIHGNANVCGVFYSPAYIEIENRADNQIQYFRGSLIGGGGMFLENISRSTSIFSCDTKSVTTIKACSSHNLALKSDGKVIVWGSQSYVPSGLTNVAAVAAGDSYGLALAGNGPPPLPAPLTNPTWTTDGFSISLPTQSGQVYRLEYASSLADTNWTVLPLSAGNGGMLTLTDYTATNSPQRFYRVLRW